MSGCRRAVAVACRPHGGADRGAGVRLGHEPAGPPRRRGDRSPHRGGAVRSPGRRRAGPRRAPRRRGDRGGALGLPRPRHLHRRGARRARRTVGRHGGPRGLHAGAGRILLRGVPGPRAERAPGAAALVPGRARGGGRARVGREGHRRHRASGRRAGRPRADRAAGGHRGPRRRHVGDVGAAHPRRRAPACCRPPSGRCWMGALVVEGRKVRIIEGSDHDERRDDARPPGTAGRLRQDGGGGVRRRARRPRGRARVQRGHRRDAPRGRACPSPRWRRSRARPRCSAAA